VVSHSKDKTEPTPALRSAGLRPYLAANALATLAAEMQSVAIGWQVYQLTGSFAQLGFVGLAQFAPFILLVLPAGHFADRHDRGRIATACLAAQALGSALLLSCASTVASTACGSSIWCWRCSAARVPSPCRPAAPWW
jgi:MFS family permease